MRTLYTLFVLSLMVLAVPGALAVSVGTGINPDISTEDFAPRVWMCDSRVVLDDNTEPGRICPPNEDGVHLDSATLGDRKCLWREDVSSYHLNGTFLKERENNYAFEGEQIVWDVLVFDKNGIEKVKDVYATIGPSQGEGNDIEVNCILDEILSDGTRIPDSCNARIGEEELDSVPDNTAAFFKCILTVETSESMYGEYWVTVEAVDLDDLMGTMDENEFWFFNPVVALSIEGDLTFDDVRPGTDSYSSTLKVGNDADEGSGVLLDMFITGTDFYDSSSSGAKCPTTNQLSLSAFRYFATSGFYSTSGQKRTGGSLGPKVADAEGYLNIPYGIGFNNPDPFYGNAEILPTASNDAAFYSPGNVLSPGAEMAVTFKLSLPEPCNGDFDTGSIFFWGEAV